MKIYALLLTLITFVSCQEQNQNISIKQTENGIAFQLEGETYMLRDHVTVKLYDSSSYDFPIHYTNKQITADLGIFGRYVETLEFNKTNQAIGSIELTVATDTSFLIQCPFNLPKDSIKPYFMIPAFLYGTNNIATSDGHQPKLNYGGAWTFPNSGGFSIRADRSTHPSVITVDDGRVFMVGIAEKMDSVEYPCSDRWRQKYGYNGLIVNTTNKTYDEIGFTIGYEHAPDVRYSWEWIKEEPTLPLNTEYRWGGLVGQGSKILKTKTIYYVDKAEAITAHDKATRAYYNEFHQEVNKRSTRLETIQKISQSIITDGYDSAGIFFYQNSSGFGRVRGDIAWTGGMQAAYPLLKSYYMSNNKEVFDISKNYIDHICKTAFNESANLMHEEFYKGEWSITGWWGMREDSKNWGDHPFHSAYLNGQASYYILKSYELLGQKDSLWLASAKRMIDTGIKGQRADGAYPKFFEPADGSPVDYDGFQSCWFAPGAARLFVLTGDSSYLESARKALDHYHEWHLRGELYGTPMDTHNSVDQEGNLAYISACKEMHSITGEQKYIDYGLEGLAWEFSWKFSYNTAHSNEPLRSMNWSSCGGSITSCFIPTIHQMGNLVAGEIYYFYQQTQDPYLASRLKDVCIWGLGTYNTKDNDFGFGTVGMATEQFFYSDCLCCPWTEQKWDGGVWQENLPWASACVLLSCSENIPDEFFGE